MKLRFTECVSKNFTCRQKLNSVFNDNFDEALKTFYHLVTYISWYNPYRVQTRGAMDKLYMMTEDKITKLPRILSLPSSSSPCESVFPVWCFPDKLKIAKMITLFKNGNSEQPTNYGPISLLPVFSKISEILMYGFLEVHNVLYSLQLGFQENLHIDHAIVSLTKL